MLKIVVEIPDFGLSIKINYKGGKKPWLYIYVKHPTNICYWSIILINAQTLTTVVIYFVHAKYQTVQMHMLQCKVLLIIMSYIWSKDVFQFSWITSSFSWNFKNKK